MFSNKNDFQPFESKVWLSSPTMYPDSMKYVMEAYETNWMSTVGANINEVERMAWRESWLQICGCFIRRNRSTSYGSKACWSKAGR